MEYNGLFSDKAIIGMIHLGGNSKGDVIKRAIRELEIYERNGFEGAIVENFHNDSLYLLIDALKEIRSCHFQIKVGVNVLPNEYQEAFPLSEDSFIQIDNIAGKYENGNLDVERYNVYRSRFPNVVVLGGVWPKYYKKLPSSNLEEDLKDGMERCDAIVVTGERTGEETPLSKIIEFRSHLRDFPLIIGAGSNPDNVSDQMFFASGVINGSYIKEMGDARNDVAETRVKHYRNAVISPQ